MANYKSDSEPTYQPDLELLEDDEIDSQFILDTLDLWKELKKNIEKAIENCNIFDQIMNEGNLLENRKNPTKEFRSVLTTPFYIYKKN